MSFPVWGPNQGAPPAAAVDLLEIARCHPTGSGQYSGFLRHPRRDPRLGPRLLGRQRLRAPVQRVVQKPFEPDSGAQRVLRKLLTSAHEV